MAPACPAGIARKNQGAQQQAARVGGGEAAGAAKGVAKAGEEAAEVAEKTTALAPAAAAIAKQLKVAAKPVTDAVVLSKGKSSGELNMQRLTMVATLPIGSVGNKNATDDRGERYVWLEPYLVDRLDQMRGPGESYSDVILWLAKASS